MAKRTFAAALLFLALGCTTTTMTPTTQPAAIPPTASDPLSSASERYVKLVLAMGEHDADYVDAYYGPPAWREEIKAQPRSVADIQRDASALRDELAHTMSVIRIADPMVMLRYEYLRRQTEALIARAEMLQGKKLSFDEESQALYDSVAPSHPESYFEALNASIGAELPGDGPLIDRLEAFRSQFVIPREKLDVVFQAAIKACRERTLAHFRKYLA
jgi:hypothetical protein